MLFSGPCEFPSSFTFPLKCYIHIPNVSMCLCHSNSCDQLLWGWTVLVCNLFTLSSLPTCGCLPSSVVSLPLISPSCSLKWSWPLFLDESSMTKALLSSAGWREKHLSYCTAFSVPITTATLLHCDSRNKPQVVDNTYPAEKPLLHKTCQNMWCTVIVKDKKNLTRKTNLCFCCRFRFQCTIYLYTQYTRVHYPAADWEHF